MNNCFKCQKATANSGEVYYRFKKLGEQNFGDYCCENCWNNHKQQILKEDKNIISVSGEKDNLHQIVYTQAKCSQCNEYKKALCQCNTEREREREQNDWIYKCLNCGKKGDELPETCCSSCKSRNLEVKVGNLSPLFGSSHFTLYECPQCHLYKDIEYHDISDSQAQTTKTNQIAEWKRNNEYCNNSSHKLNKPSQRTPNSPSQNQPNNDNSNGFNWKPVLIGGLVLAIIGLGAYFFFKNKKTKDN